MSQKTYMYDTQWTALINAIQGGDPTAIVTALGQIKTSIDAIETALGSLSADVTQDSTQWNDLITAIGSGGGGGGGTIDIDATQWSNLLTSIDKGDTSALATALGLIKSSIDSINTSLGSLSADVTQDSTQWSNLVNAITNQSITVDLSNITSDVVSNESTVTPADTVTQALDVLKSTLSKYHMVTADVNCSNVATNSWGYWGYTNIDLSQILTGKTIIAIVPQLCVLKNDFAVIGLMSFKYNAATYTLTPRVNHKNSGIYSVQFLIIYK